MPLQLRLPPLYVILDAEILRRSELLLLETAVELAMAGITLIQYRDKVASRCEVLANAKALSRALSGLGCRLILNDWADCVIEAGFDGVHVGQSDTDVERARALVGPERIVGISTHSTEQVRSADLVSADYIAVGPVFSTGSKVNAEAVIGLDGVRQARALTSKPLVAIGGISAKTARDVLLAGADSIAVISAVTSPGRTPTERTAELIAALRT